MSYVFLSLHVQGSTPCGIKFQLVTGYIFHLIDCCQSDFTEDVGQLLYIHRKILLLLLLWWGGQKKNVTQSSVYTVFSLQLPQQFGLGSSNTALGACDRVKQFAPWEKKKSNQSWDYRKPAKHSIFSYHNYTLPSCFRYSQLSCKRMCQQSHWG